MGMGVGLGLCELGLRLRLLQSDVDTPRMLFKTRHPDRLQEIEYRRLLLRVELAQIHAVCQM